MKESYTCIVIDDELAVRNRFRKLLTHFPNLVYLGSAATPEDGIDLYFQHSPNIVFVDVEMPRLTGFDVIKFIREKGGSPIFVFVTAYQHYAIKAIKASAYDYLLKPVDLEELSQVLQRLENSDLKSVSIHDNRFDCLSDREKEVLNLLFEGLTSKEIATQLFISKTTVDTHRRNILEKTGCQSTIELLTLK
ncbi:MAG TPA: response regulator transcription factor [Bacteroidales bacterium]|nr:response regulator transcription factor [Bacteroidales bacterium]